MSKSVRRGSTLSLLLLMAMVVPSLGHGQSMADRLKAKAQERLDKKIDESADKMLDKFEGAFACVVGDEECPKRAKAKGKKVVLTEKDGTILPADKQPADSPARNQAAVDAANAEGSATKAPSARPGEGAWSNYDFIPGARVLWAESFANDRVGNFPRRMELVNGNMEVVEWKSQRWLRVSSDGPTNTFVIDLPEVLPQRFTIEFDMTIPWNGVGFYSANAPDRKGSLSPERESGYVHLSGTVAGAMRAKTAEGSTIDPRTIIDDMYEDGSQISAPIRVRMEADGRYIKVYLGEKRIANLPNGDFGRANKIIFDFSDTGDEKTGRPLLGNISINAGGKEMYDALMSDGRVATQGIFFDVGSDKLRGESTPTLKEIGEMLKSHADLKLTIEGHTDSTGTAASNLTLSQKRAESIVAYLTSTYSIDKSRLVPRGFGSSKPAAKNDTPEGRQANRRVELVKM